MATPHAWHPGARGVATRWPLSVPLLPDEILSSWLVRVALGNGCDPMTLTGLLWSDWRCWTMDMDRKVPDDKLHVLSVAAGIEREQLSFANLYSLARLIREPTTDRALWPWITTLGARNTSRRAGMQFCPECLRSDLHPYFRLQWRLAWHTVCEHHGHRLVDRCPDCQSPVAYHCLDATDKQITQCHRCARELQTAETASGSMAALTFQRSADSLLRGERLNFAGRTVQSCQDWFSLASFMVTLVRRAALRKTNNLEHFLDAMKAPVPPISRIEHGVDFESMRTATRHQILSSAWILLSATRTQYQETFSSLSLSQQTLIPTGQTTPTLLQDLVATLPDNSHKRKRQPITPQNGPMSMRSVVASMATLERRLRRRRL
ncbi:MAG: TniQ family protein [Marinosulfonomonas sp.]